MANITYADKVENSGSTAEGRLSAADANEIKTVVNRKQDSDSDLTAIAALTPSNDDILQRKSGAWTSRTVAQVKTDLALNNVDNTSDVNKPVSTAQQTALDLKVDKETFTSVTFADPLVLDCGNKQNPLFKTTVTGNFTLDLSNVKSGSLFTALLTITPTTEIEMTFDTGFTNEIANSFGAVTTYLLPAGSANRKYIVQFIADGTTLIWAVPIAITQSELKTGASIEFTENAIYNTPSTPSSATFSSSLTGAEVGVTVVAYFNHAVEPSWGSGFYPVGTWNPSNLNVVTFRYVDSSNISVQINSDTESVGVDNRFGIITLSSDSTTTGTTAVAITDAVIPMLANSKYLVECKLSFRNDGGGTKFGASGQTGWILSHSRFGNTLSASFLKVSSEDTTSFFSSQAWGAYVASAPLAVIHDFDLVVATNATAGNLQINFASFTSGQLSTIIASEVL